MRVALTGGIATGKSVVGRALREAGLPVIDADLLAREAVAPGTAALQAVATRFGAVVVRPDGTLDRAALGAIVFADGAARHDLEGIIHPRVRAGIEAFFATASAHQPAIAEIPLAYETGWAASFPCVVVVACRPEVQLARLKARDGLTTHAAAARLAAQWPIADKVRLADAVVVTDGDLAGTHAQAARLARWLRGRSRPS